MKILAIGNSFSQDATMYLHKLAACAGVDLQITNVARGGCSFQMHIDSYSNNRPDYLCEINGVLKDTSVALNDIIFSDDWDAVVIQQVSQNAGLLETYYPYAEILLDEIKKIKSKPKVYFQQTWAYEIDSTHGGFEKYDFSQQKMYEQIVETTHKFADTHNLSLIPSGEVIQRLREQKLFDYSNGGISLCRDGFHMNHIYGRYAIAAVWFEIFSGKSIYDSDFILTRADLQSGIELQEFDFDVEKAEIIKSVVHEICSKYK